MAYKRQPAGFKDKLAELADFKDKLAKRNREYTITPYDVQDKSDRKASRVLAYVCGFIIAGAVGVIGFSIVMAVKNLITLGAHRVVVQ